MVRHMILCVNNINVQGLVSFGISYKDRSILLHKFSVHSIAKTAVLQDVRDNDLTTHYFQPPSKTLKIGTIDGSIEVIRLVR